MKSERFESVYWKYWFKKISVCLYLRFFYLFDETLKKIINISGHIQLGYNDHDLIDRYVQIVLIYRFSQRSRTHSRHTTWLAEALTRQSFTFSARACRDFCARSIASVNLLTSLPLTATLRTSKKKTNIKESEKDVPNCYIKMIFVNI